MRSLAICIGVFFFAGCARVIPFSPPTANADMRGAFEPSSSPFRTIYRFSGKNGALPEADLMVLNGTIYGTTTSGGQSGAGTIFKISPSGVEKVLHSFGGQNDGAQPGYGAPILVKGELYGITTGLGAVYKITTSGRERIIYTFKGGTVTPPDGSDPTGGLIAINGVLYGTTQEGGKNDAGTVFRLTTSGNEKILYSFKGGNDGQDPIGGLTAVNGVLYGTTQFGGTSGGYGTVFRVTTKGDEKVLHSFGGTLKHDGAYPTGPLTPVKGVLYGTTEFQGSSGQWGTVFSVTTSGKEKVLHNFTSNPDGANPTYGRLINVKGTLYGVTRVGGVGYGTIFKVSTNGSEHVVYSIPGGSAGEYPYGGLALLRGRLYGTTNMGGNAISYGTVFSIAP